MARHGARFAAALLALAMPPMPMLATAPAAAQDIWSLPGPGPGATPEQQKCAQEFQAYREEVERRARVAVAESKQKPTREKMCELVGLYSTAEFKWLKFSETNMARCSIPEQAIEQIKQVHVRTVEAKNKLCARAQSPSDPRDQGDAPPRMLDPPLRDRDSPAHPPWCPNCQPHSVP